MDFYEFFDLILWLLASIGLILKLRVLVPASLASAPVRRSTLNLPVIGVVIVVYIFLQVVVLIAAGQAGFLKLEALSPPAQSAPAATTLSASAPAAPLPATSAPTPAPATSTSAPSSEGLIPGLDPSTRPLIEDRVDAETGQDVPQEVALMLASTLVYLMLGVPLLILGRYLFPGGYRAWGLHPRQIPAGVGAGIVGFLIVLPVLFVIGTGLEMLYEALHHQIPSHETLVALEQPTAALWQKIVLIGGAVIVAPVAEEFFFRGILQTTLVQFAWGLFVPQLALKTDRWAAHRPSPAHRWGAVVISSLFFAWMHQAEHRPIIFALSLGLGCVYERTGLLWASISLHACFNAYNVMQVVDARFAPIFVVILILILALLRYARLLGAPAGMTKHSPVDTLVARPDLSRDTN